MSYPASQVMYSPVMQSPGMQPPVMQPPMMHPSAMQPPVAYGVHQPLLHGMQSPPNPMPGYEGIGGGFLPPPPIAPMPTPDPQPAHEWSIPALTKERAKEAFKDYANDNCCYSSNPATEGVINKMEQFDTYRYRLKTYTESRKTEWATKPYNGQPLAAFSQMVPNPWEIQVKVPTMFTDSTQDVEVPNTASVRPCDTCSASGKCQCKKCGGSDTQQCTLCTGSGKVGTEEQTCSKCNGCGKTKCDKCKNGTVDCATCNGKKQLLMYIKLTVEWKNNINDYLTEQSSDLDKTKLTAVSGKSLFEDTKLMVYPLIGFPQQSVAEASERLIKEHQSKYSQTSRVLQQQQSVELIPITKVTYRWKEKDHTYYVYGIESKVTTDDYPAKCCCTII